MLMIHKKNISILRCTHIWIDAMSRSSTKRIQLLILSDVWDFRLCWIGLGWVGFAVVLIVFVNWPRSFQLYHLRMESRVRWAPIESFVKSDVLKGFYSIWSCVFENDWINLWGMQDSWKWCGSITNEQCAKETNLHSILLAPTICNNNKTFLWLFFKVFFFSFFLNHFLCRLACGWFVQT